MNSSTRVKAYIRGLCSFLLAIVLVAAAYLIWRVESPRSATGNSLASNKIAPNDACPDAKITDVAFDQRTNRIRLRVRELQPDGAVGMSYIAVQLQCMSTDQEPIVTTASLSGHPPSLQVILPGGTEKQFSIAPPDGAILGTCKPTITQCIYPLTE